MKIALIKYNAGNVQSLIFALNRLGASPLLTDDVNELKSADKVIFPGVGEASSTMRYLREKGLDRIIPTFTQPFLGICLGMQLMCNHSEEGDTDCLGIYSENVIKFDHNGSAERLKIPQIGWNRIYHLKSPLFRGISDRSFMYFVHSYYVEPGNQTIATTDYVREYSSALQKDNFYSVQFHPEKSSETGQKILENFLKL